MTTATVADRVRNNVAKKADGLTFTCHTIAKELGLFDCNAVNSALLRLCAKGDITDVARLGRTTLYKKHGSTSPIGIPDKRALLAICEQLLAIAEQLEKIGTAEPEQTNVVNFQLKEEQ
jgi:hypothetical protein